MKMLIMQQWISVTLIAITADVFAESSNKDHRGSQICGGHLNGPTGIIHTPNFPNPFPVPIKCKWIIEHSVVNGTIAIYFTQQYTTSGLTFTEYAYYDETYKLEERRALTVTEENITKIKLIQVRSPVLVVELSLNRLEGTQLRALGLLSVFGFNITYAVRSPIESAVSFSCSAIECRLLGHCFATQDHRQFYCSCFPGYSGVDCGMGPLCSRTPSICKNGGTCRQMGPATVSCICEPGYTGNLCEMQNTQRECGLEECMNGCAKGKTCKCTPRDDDMTSARFDTRLQIVDQPNINISTEIIKQLTSYLTASNITLDDEIAILNISSVDDNGARTAYIRVWSDQRAASSLRAALARLAASRTRPQTLRLLPDALQFEMQPALNLQALIVNQRQELWEGSELILTCMAYGSSEITFTWFKNGVKINFNATTRDIWTRTISEDELGRRTSVLGVSTVQHIDGGAWSCVAVDAGRRRCRSLTLTVLSPPTIRLLPSSLTIYKGGNVSLTCLTSVGHAYGVLGFSWARERSLLRMQPDRHVWEDLYPTGSVLKLYNVQKSSEYRCQVTSAAGTNSVGIWVWALDVDDDACQSDVVFGICWSRTAPGAYSLNTCPTGYSGEIIRYCEPKTEQHGIKWMLPDYSGCVADSLDNIYQKFIIISNGYSWENISEISSKYLSVLRSFPLLRGAGAAPLRHANDMLQYLLSDVAGRADKLRSATNLLNIYDHLLSQPDAFLDEQNIYALQSAIVQAANIRRKFEAHLHSFSVKSESSVNMELHHKPRSLESNQWSVESTRVELLPTFEDLTIVTVLYQELGTRLPSLRTLTEYSSATEVQYTLYSQQVQVYISGASSERTLQVTVTLLMKHSMNHSVDGSKLACGFRSADLPSTWHVSECDVRISDVIRATCRCRGPGTLAIFIQNSYRNADNEDEFHGILMICLNVSGAMCICVCILQILSALAVTTRRRDIIYTLLAACTATGHAPAMFALSNFQKVPLPNILEWAIACCWCIASAALCAQPLLLHAELTGTEQRSHSVGLLAGICVLCCLSARLWGGAPLQAGSAASSIFVGGILLLTTLTLALSICTRKMVTQVTQKLPPDRRTYDRNQILHNTLVLLLTTSAVQVASVAYAQFGEKPVVYTLVLSAAAFANGVTLLVCYVIRDEECLRAVRSILPLHDNIEWQDATTGDNSISLYIKQSGEVESRGGVVMLESSPVSSNKRYWHAAPLERRRSNPDSRADIVRCVEHMPSMYSSTRYEMHTHAVCDLVATSVESMEHAAEQYVATVCLETAIPHKTISVMPCFEPYTEKQFDTAKETCTICVQSNPDVSKMTSTPVKSCLKKNPRGVTSSTSLPSIDTIKDDNNKPHIEQINREWNKAYDNPQTSKVLNKISNDLDFLLNRRQSNNTPHLIEEAPI